MQLYVDGSSVCSPSGKHGKRKFALGWGIVAHFAGYNLEVQGGILVPLALRGLHEGAAIVEAVLLAHARGYGPDDVVINTDCSVFGYANGSLHPGNYLGCAAENLKRQLHALTSVLYSEATYELVLHYLQHARVNKLKGHSFLVDQERADYLAKQRAWQSLEGTTESPLSFDEWLVRGFEYYTRDSETPLLRYPAFTATETDAISV